MKSNYVDYNFLKSIERIDEILTTSDSSFEELDYIPAREKLTFTNGFYVKCSALFVDIRKSSELTDKHRRPTPAKIYRVFISEVVAVMNGDLNCAEINVVGDCVWGIFNTPYKEDIDSLFSKAAKISSLIDIMNCKFKKRGIAEIKIGIGISYGRALMVKAGYKGSCINEVVWMGDVVNKASILAKIANKTAFDKEIMVTNLIYNNLSEKKQKLLEKDELRDCYRGDVINIKMNKWYKENCKEQSSTW